MDVQNKPKYRKEVDGLIYKTVETKSEVEKCFDLYQNSFLKDEPITKTFRIESEQSKEEKVFFDKVYFYDMINQGVSLIVIDPAADGKIIGMRISGICNRSCLFESSEKERQIDPISRWKVMCKEIALSKSPQSRSKIKWKIAATKARYLNINNNESQPELSSFSFYINFLNAAMDAAGSAEELFLKEGNLNRIYYMMMMTVDPTYRGRGIASKLITCCFEVGRLNDCDSAFVVATNPITAKIFRKHQMNNLRSTPWNSIEYAGGFPCQGKDLGSENIESFYIKL